MSDLSEAFKELADPEGSCRSRQFPVASRNFIQRKKDEMKRKDRAAARKLIRPENADAIIADFPRPGHSLHGITCGDFVMGDMIERVEQLKGSPREIIISTLSLSVSNSEMLARIMKRNPDLKIELVISHYFQSTNGDVYRALEEILVAGFPERFRVGVSRTHAKVILFDFPSASYVVETSANLRSSNNIEQFTIENDRELLKFHKTWIHEVLAIAEADGK